MKDRVARSLFWLVLSRVGLQPLIFVNTIMVARWLHPSDYGLIAIATVWTEAIWLVAAMGLREAIIQFRDLEEKELNACFWSMMSVAVIGYLALYMASPVISVWFASPQLTDIVRLLGLTLPLQALRSVPESLLRKRLEVDKVVKAESGAALLHIPVVLSMAWAGAGVWALVSGLLVRALVQDAMIFYYLRWCPGLRMGGKQLGAIFRYGLTTLGSRICWSLHVQTDTVVLGKIAGEAVLGLYSMARTLALLPVSTLAPVLRSLALPMMAELQGNLTEMRNTMLMILRLTACISFPICIGLMIVAADLIRVLLSDQWLPIVPMVQLLPLYALIQLLGLFLTPVLQARYQVRFLFGYSLILLVVMSLAFWAGAVWVGSMGIIAAWVVIYPIVTAFMAREVFKELEISWMTVFRQMGRGAGATLVMAGVVLMVQWVLSGDDDFVASLVRLLLGAAAGALTYGLVLFLWDDPALGELRQVVSRVLRPAKSEATAKQDVKRHREKMHKLYQIL